MKKVAILGTAPSCRDMAPYDDPSWDIWVCSPGNMNAIKRTTLWFELHSIIEMEAKENQGWALPYFAWLRQQVFPVYMQEPNEHVPGAVVFPYLKLIEHFGTRNWFTSSPAYMLAYAIFQKVDEIGIFGVDMAAPEEHYTMQRGGLIYWIERAQAMGIKVTIPMESCLGQPVPLYGYNESSRFGRRLNVVRGLIGGAVQQKKQQRDQLTVEIAFHEGAAAQLDYVIRTFVDGKDDAELDIEQIAAAKPVVVPSWPKTNGHKDPELDIDPKNFERAPGGLLVPTAEKRDAPFDF